MEKKLHKLKGEFHSSTQGFRVKIKYLFSLLSLLFFFCSIFLVFCIQKASTKENQKIRFCYGL